MNLSSADRSRLARVKLLFTDIDETLSTEGKITPAAYDALWRARDGGIDVVPTTGRPAGWCDHIARMWPVLGVVGENGGMYFRMTPQGMERAYASDEKTRNANRRRIDSIRSEILDSVPGTALASDQPYRELDLAIDFCEDVEPLPREQVQRIVSIFEKHGATAKVSSIHVNGWFGTFDKLSMAKRLAQEVCGLDLAADKEAAAFIGDSPNDEPMFKYFPLSFGVSNINAFLDQLKSPPSFVLDHSAGAGFAELVDMILSARNE